MNKERNAWAAYWSVALQVRLAGHPCCIELNGGVAVNDEMERIWEDVVVAEWREYPCIYLFEPP